MQKQTKTRKPNSPLKAKLLTPHQFTEALRAGGLPVKTTLVELWLRTDKLPAAVTPSGRRFIDPMYVDQILNGTFNVKPGYSALQKPRKT